MKNLRHNLPLPINLDHSQIVRVIRLRRVHLDLGLDNRRRRGDGNHVKVGLDLVTLLALVQVIEQVGNGAALELAVDVTVDASVGMETLLGTLGAGLLHGVDVTVCRRDHGVVLGAGDLLGHCCYRGWRGLQRRGGLGDLRTEMPTLGIRALNVSGRKAGFVREGGTM